MRRKPNWTAREKQDTLHTRTHTKQEFKFVLKYVHCLIHELPEIYAKHTGKRPIHGGPNKDELTDTETDMVRLFMEEVRIPDEELSEFERKSF